MVRASVSLLLVFCSSVGLGDFINHSVIASDASPSKQRVPCVPSFLPSFPSSLAPIDSSSPFLSSPASIMPVSVQG
ncbi:hypothetical protein ASPCADRAFT_207598 [Aspergillus carbonarius ITEM 5010]|uniref:Secreted protein n=1 Tax=Aspergillus carbonarius (strain ITEM 5010) TaxID=602072 RepID=A0A1R3RKS2_ASPC5|nr:hypothetical protein ASPCADRAFT_207598 [Aspergillus carbonarius ITEM 5010]